MRRLNTAQFKREYRSLGEPVLVTSGGKVIGLYRPTNRSIIDYELPTSTGEPSKHQVPATTGIPLDFGQQNVLRWWPFAYPEDPNAR